MDLPANRPVPSPAKPSQARRWWSRPQAALSGPPDSAELDVGYESAQPWLSMIDAVEPHERIELPR